MDEGVKIIAQVERFEQRTVALCKSRAAELSLNIHSFLESHSPRLIKFQQDRIHTNYQSLRLFQTFPFNAALETNLEETLA